MVGNIQINAEKNTYTMYKRIIDNHIGDIRFKRIAALMGDTEKMVIEVYNHIMEEKEDLAAVVMDAVIL